MPFVPDAPVNFFNGASAPTAANFSKIASLLNNMAVNLADLKLANETDWSSAVERAVALGPVTIIVPPSANGLPIVRPIYDHPNGNTFIGLEGAANCKFLIDAATFNANGAPGVRNIPSTASELYAGGDGVGFKFIQPSGRTRANLVQFSAAVYANNVSRMKWGHLRVEGGYNGCVFTGNCGGMLADSLEMGVLNVGMLADGSYDWWDIGTFTTYPWGIADRSDLSAIYYDSNTVGWNSGRIDGVNIGNMDLLCAQMITRASTADGTFGFGQIGRLNLDSDGARWDKTGGQFQVGTAYMSKTTSGTYSVAHHGGADSSLAIGNLVVNSAAPQHTFLDDSAGFTRIGGGYVQFQNAGFSTFYNTAGELHVSDMKFGSLMQNQVRTRPLIDVLAGRCSLRGLRMTDIGSGSGLFYRIYNDDFHVVNDCQLVGWGYQIPTRPSGGYTGTYIVNGTKQ